MGHASRKVFFPGERGFSTIFVNVGDFLVDFWVIAVLRSGKSGQIQRWSGPDYDMGGQYITDPGRSQIWCTKIWPDSRYLAADCDKLRY